MKHMIPRRRSTHALLALALAILLIGATWVDAALRLAAADARLNLSSNLVATLGLTDLALFTEARYTRHYSQADLHSAFQEHPVALDHFPSGSFLPPPRRERMQ